MTDFEVEFTDGSSTSTKELVKNVQGYADSSNGQWIDFLKSTNSPGSSQVRRFLANRVVGIKRTGE